MYLHPSLMLRLWRGGRRKRGGRDGLEGLNGRGEIDGTWGRRLVETLW